MRAVILAAGSSTRMGGGGPKGMLDINGTPMLQRQVDVLRDGGITDVVVVTGRHGDAFSLDGVRYVEDVDHERHDVLLSLMAARREITGDVIISYSDILYDMDVLDGAVRSKADIGMVTDMDWRKRYEGRTEHPISEADIVLVDGGRVVRTGKGIPADGAAGEFIGMVKLSSSGSATLVSEFERVAKTGPGPFHGAQDFERAYLTDMIQEMIDRGIMITPVAAAGRWIEVDTPQDLGNARREFT
ncbi:MAG: NTP transferase domain-containing protein [Nitrosopumilus sp.]|nr:NTP transferase domain-containing protein [Nitrosopumilus sp.]